MTHANLNRRTFLAGVSAAALAPTAPLYAAEQEEPKRGIGGTGIVGTLTDFGSLMVNGKRVLLTPDTVISGPLGAMVEADLAIGHALTIETALDLTTARVFVADPVIGRVKAVYRDQRAFCVDGVVVRLDPTLNVLPQSSDWVTVSGLWRGDEVIATRVASSTPGVSALAGVFRKEQSALPRIGSERIFLPDTLSAPADGTFIVVRGAHQAGSFFVDEMSVGRFTDAAGPLKDLSVEGYLSPTAKAPFFEVDGLGHSFDAGA